MTQSKTIYKYPLEVTDRQTINIHFHAKFLCVQVQNGVPCLWAEVNPDKPLGKRDFEIYGTGHKLNTSEQSLYVGTFQLGDFVGHVYEIY